MSTLKHFCGTELLLNHKQLHDEFKSYSTCKRHGKKSGLTCLSRLKNLLFSIVAKLVFLIIKTNNSRVMNRARKRKELNKMKESRAEVVAKLVERSLPTPEVRSLNPVIGKLLYRAFVYCQLYIKDEKRGREWPIF